jgi:hypothetical protein
VAAIDLAAYSINPQVHAFDNLTLVENLEPQADTLATARTFLGGKPVAVSPVTLRPRFNPLPAGPYPGPPPPPQWPPPPPDPPPPPPPPALTPASSRCSAPPGPWAAPST